MAACRGKTKGDQDLDAGVDDEAVRLKAVPPNSLSLSRVHGILHSMSREEGGAGGKTERKAEELEGLDVPEAKDMSLVKYGLGLAKLRLDGFVSLQAAPIREGLFISKPIEVSGELVINAVCRDGGYLDVEVADEHDEIIEGFGREDFIRYAGDKSRHVCRWNNRNQLPAGGKVKLRIWMKDADLFSLLFK